MHVLPWELSTAYDGPAHLACTALCAVEDMSEEVVWASDQLAAWEDIDDNGTDNSDMTFLNVFACLNELGERLCELAFRRSEKLPMHGAARGGVVSLRAYSKRARSESTFC